jgi:bile acid-coenzyme A ligase
VFIRESGDEAFTTYAELEAGANRAAHLLKQHGVGPASVAVLAMPSHPVHITAAYAAWKLGACVLPYNHRAPEADRTNLLEVARSFRSCVVIGTWADGTRGDVSRDELEHTEGLDPKPLPDIIPRPDRAIGSGGTTGKPKLTIADSPGAVTVADGVVPLDASLEEMGMRHGYVQLVCTPLFHTSGFGWSHFAILHGHKLVLLERFNASRVLDAVEQHRVNFSMVVPSVMQRLLEVPDVAERDLSSWVAFNHAGAPCPAWIKRRWLALLPPEHVYEGYGATEDIGGTCIRGDDWLEHPGTVGRPSDSDLKILDDDGNEQRAGDVGEIFMRPKGATEPTFRYVGADYRRVAPGGFVTLGDFGWVDEEGFLFVADRRVDMIITGGANVYPAEVEAVLSAYPGIADAAVIGLLDERWGRRVHACIQPRDPSNPPAIEDIDRHCREQLAPYKVPKTYEFVEMVPRSEVGKLARRILLEAREPVSSQGR